ncbi:hypothetical protein PV04_04163 [Phialophora macrospora]|uniref:DUF7924 domain-containing protein n=1 Tax=Phialophora macrospora TaxID=1851006 RepID=A0A0D2E1J4_9EURO|nr:hypothetical protein PV04_04163 [Phialophora macrospora]
MAYVLPQLTSPASTPSSQTSLSFPSREISRERAVPFASSYYRQYTLHPNCISVDDSHLTEEQWSRHAFALGMPSRDVPRAHPEVRRFTQRLQRKPRMSDKQLTELLLPLIQTATQSSKKLQVKTNTAFHTDAVPNGNPVGRLSSQNATWSMPLPVPKPNITIGFSSKNFTEHELELQDGIISNAHGEPCNLAKLSQPVVGNNTLLWPFLTVEIQSSSLQAAQNAAAGSSSTCNNALALLAEAAQEHFIQLHGRNLFWQSQRAVQSFSLSIHNDSEGNSRMATLNLHTSQGGLSHNSAPIRSYALCDEKDVECLLSRLTSIFVWAENCHLQQIFTLLANLDAIVRLDTGREHLSDGFPSAELDGAMSVNGSLSPGWSKLGAIRSVLAQVSPKWIRTS